MVLAGCATELSQARLDEAQKHANVVVVDLELAEEANEVDGITEAIAGRVVLLTSSKDVSTLDKAVLAGVRGIVRKNEPAQVLLKAVEKVHEGELWIDRGATSRIFMQMARQQAAQQNDPERMKIGTLTTRERQMIVAVARDTASPGKVIASRLCISEHTLRNHLSSIYNKLGLSSRLDLYAYATRHRLDKPPEQARGA